MLVDIATALIWLKELPMSDASIKVVDQRKPSSREERLRALEKEYGKVCSNFRTLTDIRFRLLGLLPIIAAAAAAFKFDTLAPISRFTLAIFGLVATIGLITYNSRNDQLYNELVGRAAAIERCLALQDGYFTQRPNSWLQFRFGFVKWEISHGYGIGTIYTPTLREPERIACQSVRLGFC